MVFYGQLIGEVHFIHTNISNNYLTTRNGIYYFQRRVPKDVKSHYKSYSITFSLKTRTRKIALRAASSLSFQLDEYWMTLRVNQLASIHCKKLQTSFNNTSSGTTFSDAKDLYLKLKGQGKGESFFAYSEQNFGYLVEAVGNKDLIDYKLADGGLFRDWLIKKGLASSSVKRVFSPIRAITNLAIAEYGLDMRSPFANVYFPELDDIKERLPVSSHDTKLIQRHCRETNDEMRWLLALISDTGMRLSEAAGLALNDIVLDSEIPYINLKPNESRRLKTKQSSRKIPLVGLSLWAAQRVKSEFNGTYAFPRYTKGGRCNANSASAVLNKWVKKITTQPVSLHSFCHSLTDRFRAVQCPRDIIDAIGGWTVGSISEKYGEGYKLDVLHEWMVKLIID